MIKVPPRPDAKPAKPKPPLTLAQLPAECKVVLEARAKDGLEADAKVLPEAGKPSRAGGAHSKGRVGS